MNSSIIEGVVSELKDRQSWYKHDYARRFDVSFSSVKDNCPRVDASQISPRDFINKYERHYLPVVITNLQTHWKAKEKWNFRVGMAHCTVTGVT